MLYALWGSLTVGVFGFLQKIEAESKINRNSFLLYSHVWMIFCPLFYVLITWSALELNKSVLLYTFMISSIYVIVIKFRLKSLEYLDTSSYFINYRIFSSILLLILWQIFFWETISIKEYLWIFLWFIIFYLLIEKKNKELSNTNLLNGFLYLGVWIVWVSWIWIIQKNFVLLDLDFTSYIFSSWVIWALITLIFKEKNETYKEVIQIKKMKHICFLMISWIIFPLWMFFHLNAMYHWWDVAVIYKIVSYSLFITILLSIIFYKEKVTFKKLLAFILTIASIWLFV
jgi:uncharacterized membrane protein